MMYNKEKWNGGKLILPNTRTVSSVYNNGLILPNQNTRMRMMAGGGGGGAAAGMRLIASVDQNNVSDGKDGGHRAGLHVKFSEQTKVIKKETDNEVLRKKLKSFLTEFFYETSAHGLVYSMKFGLHLVER